MTVEFSDISNWSNTTRKHIPKSRCSYRWTCGCLGVQRWYLQLYSCWLSPLSFTTPQPCLYMALSRLNFSMLTLAFMYLIIKTTSCYCHRKPGQ